MMIDIIVEPKGKVYQDLLDLCSIYCSKFLLVVHDELGLSTAGFHFLDIAQKFLLNKIRSRTWPGTESLDEEAAVYQYELAQDSIVILKSHACGLYDWVQPELPEDLCFIRSDGSAFLVSIAHEKDAYIDADSATEQEVEYSLSKIGVKYRKK